MLLVTVDINTTNKQVCQFKAKIYGGPFSTFDSNSMFYFYFTTLVAVHWTVSE